MTVGSLFSGIGGFDLGFERAGFEIKWMCEKDEFCRRVLRKHWPEVPIYEDITTLENPPGVDVLIGGFPCQDISLAGKGAGLSGARSGLWWEFYRLIRDVRPRYAVVENVAALVRRGLPAILGALSEIGYDAEWTIVSAASVGARTLEKDCSLWPTPKSSPSGPDYARANRDGSGGDDLATAVARELFPTPSASSARQGQNEHDGRRGQTLIGAARGQVWNTPTAQDAKNSTLPVSQASRDSVVGDLLRSGHEPGGQLNPDWVDWLMGFPTGWTDLRQQETLSFPPSPNTSPDA